MYERLQLGARFTVCPQQMVAVREMIKIKTGGETEKELRGRGRSEGAGGPWSCCADKIAFHISTCLAHAWHVKASQYSEAIFLSFPPCIDCKTSHLRLWSPEQRNSLSNSSSA